MTTEVLLQMLVVWGVLGVIGFAGGYIIARTMLRKRR